MAERNFVGGLVGDASDTKISDIKADNIIINASKECVGGIVGYVHGTKVENQGLKNIKITNSSIIGNKSVGGVSGSGVGYGNNINVNKCDITGTSNVGGLVGSLDWGTIQKGTKVENSNIKGKNYIGGIAGMGQGNNYYSVVDNCVIEGIYADSMRVGGIAGLGTNSLGCKVNGSRIVSKGMYVGGITGDNQQLQHCYSIDNYIEGYSYVGGISGCMDVRKYCS